MSAELNSNSSNNAHSYSKPNYNMQKEFPIPTQRIPPQVMNTNRQVFQHNAQINPNQRMRSINNNRQLARIPPSQMSQYAPRFKPPAINQQFSQLYYNAPHKINSLPPVEYVSNAFEYVKKSYHQQLAIGPPPTPIEYSRNRVHRNSQIALYRANQIVPVEQYVKRSIQRANDIAPIEYVSQNVLPRLSKANIKLDKKFIRNKFAELKRLKKTNRQIPYFTLSFTVLAICSISFFCTGQLGPIIYDLVIKYAALNPSGIITFFWKQPPASVNVCIYLMGIENGDEFVKGAKPYIKEHGPFCYYLRIRFDILKWKKKTVEVMLKLNLKYNRADSISLDTPLKFINLPIFGAIFATKSFLDDHYLSFVGPIVYNAIMLALRASGDEMIEEITAYNIFENYKIRFLDYIEMFLFKPLRMLGIPIPKEGDFKLLSFSLKNWSIGVASTLSSGRIGPIEFYRWSENGTYIGELKTILGVRSFMDNPMCMKNRGVKVYDAILHPVTTDRLLLNLPFFCREFWISKRQVHRFYGTQVTRYSLDEQMFNKSLPENSCYCRKENRAECEGWQDMSQCIISAPIGYSFPQFYKSPNLLRKVNGLKPNAKEHECFFDIETNLGVPIHFRIALQFLLDVTPVRSVLSMRTLPSIRLPLFWLKVHYGDFGILGYLIFLLSSLYRYGSYLWLLSGMIVSAFLFCLGLRQRGIIQFDLNVSKLIYLYKDKLVDLYRKLYDRYARK